MRRGIIKDKKSNKLRKKGIIIEESQTTISIDLGNEWITKKWQTK